MKIDKKPRKTLTLTDLGDKYLTFLEENEAKPKGLEIEDA